MVSQPGDMEKESILSYTENKCIGCGQCIEICPSGAQQIQNGQHIYERTLCTVCGKCVEICCTEALEIVGSYYSAEELSELCSETEDSMKFQKVVLLFPVENQ